MMKRSLILIAVAAAIACSGARADVSVEAAAARIDELAAAGWSERSLEPNPRASDEVFLRRAYLDIVGRIPTPEEASAFLKSEAPGKRDRLVEILLDSPGYVSHQLNFWSDVLRVTDRLPGQGPGNGRAYQAWLREAIETNMPYDEFVRELITATGFVEENGAVGFYLRDRGMPLDHLATTAQVFLGTQMVCAQCHDHPFGDWTQMDYYKLAAFSAPMESVRAPAEVADKFRSALRDVPRSERRRMQRALGAFTYAFRNSVVEETRKPLKLPHDYQYEDAKPNEVVDPATPFGDVVRVADDVSRIEAYAEWMTSETNPRFAPVIANRLWKRAIGVGLVEPVDDLDNAGSSVNEPLFDYLAELIVKFDYDMKKFQRAIFSTELYSRSASVFDPASGEPFAFTGPALRRMNAEQIWDSLVTLLRGDPDDLPMQEVRKDIEDEASSARLDLYRRVVNLDAKTLLDSVEKLEKWTETSRQEFKALEDRVDKAIASKDLEAARDIAAEVTDFTRRTNREYAEITLWGDDYSDASGFAFRTPLRNQPRLLLQKLSRAFPGANIERAARQRAAGMAMTDRRRSDRGDAVREEMREEFMRIRRTNGAAAADAFRGRMENARQMRGYVRASELRSPAPEGHFLQEFGQSDRQLIENSSDQATVPQALALLNGDIYPKVTSKASALGHEIEAAAGADETIDAIYLAMLSRKPTDRERSILAAEFDAAPETAADSAVWAVLNSQQFIFVE